MTSQQELRDLIRRAQQAGAIVITTTCPAAVLEGRDIITSVKVAGLPGVGPFPMATLTAAERLREVLPAVERQRVAR
jgi:hypothetical protein